MTLFASFIQELKWQYRRLVNFCFQNRKMTYELHTSSLLLRRMYSFNFRVRRKHIWLSVWSFYDKDYGLK